MSQIELNRLCKSFTIYERGEGFLGALRGSLRREKRLVHAVRDVSMRVEEGELIGYIGPNGAGKSTTIKMMSGILVPDSGDIRILGRCLTRSAPRTWRISASCSGSAASFGGTRPCSIPLSCCATFTACPKPITNAAWTTSSRCWTRNRCFPCPCASYRSASA